MSAQVILKDILSLKLPATTRTFTREWPDVHVI